MREGVCVNAREKEREPVVRESLAGALEAPPRSSTVFMFLGLKLTLLPLFLCLSEYACIYIYIYTHIYIHIRILAFAYMCIYINVSPCMYMYQIVCRQAARDLPLTGPGGERSGTVVVIKNDLYDSQLFWKHRTLSPAGVASALGRAMSSYHRS